MNRKMIKMAYKIFNLMYEYQNEMEKVGYGNIKDFTFIKNNNTGHIICFGQDIEELKQCIIYLEKMNYPKK